MTIRDRKGEEGREENLDKYFFLRREDQGKEETLGTHVCRGSWREKAAG